jgi:hypothetical protein
MGEHLKPLAALDNKQPLNQDTVLYLALMNKTNVDAKL